MKSSFVTSTISNIFIILFIYTGISKLAGYGTFKEQISMSPILYSWASAIAWLLPVIELITAVLLFIPAWRMAGLYLSLVLMAFFTGYIIFIMLFDKQLPCSCGGIIQQLSWTQHLIVNGFLTAFALIGIYLQRRHSKETDLI